MRKNSNKLRKNSKKKSSYASNKIEGNPLTENQVDEVIENDIPPRITKKLADGKIDFAGFLAECKDYLTKGKVLAQPDTPPDIPNLGAVPGSSAKPDGKPTPDAYDNEIY